MEPEHDFYD